jgi:hypothetical protein
MNRPAFTATAGLLALLVAAGCSSTAHNSTAAGPTTTTPAAATTTSSAVPQTPATTGNATSSPTSAAPSGPTACTTTQLSASLGPSDGTAGTIYYPLILRNVGPVECIEQGYPGVSFVAGAAGDQVGAAAERQPGSAPSVRLAPGASATAELAVVDAGNFPSDCNITSVQGLRVYPPEMRTALFVPHTDRGCANTKYVTLRISPLQGA